ncbi:putative ZIP domain-containing protein [Cardiosporidium cionae]|uniref:ZIP domain-containing protein n=1 Tax=Cardiosporidium cionae TaxID=476202 RepID=A0ABQ7J8D8_9APIC|nr:putative ZIP domain-containing protein [Cardiosporidium cionae]|eukprot:KAF8820242.1 putative ZIP domain-containing protein [Cardiosporidium cionae]
MVVVPLLLVAKAASIIAFAASSALGILLSIHLSKSIRLTTVVAACNATAAGALLSLWLFHLLPEFFELVENGSFLLKFRAIQLEYLFIFIGFSSMLLSASISHFPSSDSPSKQQCVVTPQLDKEIELSSISSPSKYQECCEEYSLEEYRCREDCPKDEIDLPSLHNSLPLNPKLYPLEGKRSFLPIFAPLGKLPWGTIFFGAAFTAHGFFEGFVVGSKSTVSGVFLVTAAMVLHKWIESVAIVLGRKASVGKWDSTMWIVLIIAALSSPIGIVVGAVATRFPEFWCCLFSALSVGIILYAVAHLTEEAFFEDHAYPMWKFAMFLIGAAIVYVTVLLGSILDGSD